jgi:hypothetical protein
LVVLLVRAVRRAELAARPTQARNNLKQIMLALNHYHDDYGTFPPPCVPNETLPSSRRLSWLVLALPYLELPELYNAINLEHAWDSLDNRTAARTCVEVFLNPASPDMKDSAGYALIYVAGVSGWESAPNGIFSACTKIDEITDGTSVTAAIGQVRDQPGPWIAAGPATVRAMRPTLNGDSLTFGSHHEGGLHLGFADGTVRFISQSVPARTLQALATYAGGETLNEDEF